HSARQHERGTNRKLPNIQCRDASVSRRCQSRSATTSGSVRTSKLVSIQWPVLWSKYNESELRLVTDAALRCHTALISECCKRQPLPTRTLMQASRVAGS